MRELAKERKKKRELASDIQEERRWECSEVEEDVTAIGQILAGRRYGRSYCKGCSSDI